MRVDCAQVSAVGHCLSYWRQMVGGTKVIQRYYI